MENNVSFYGKQRVVLREITCRFVRSIGSFFRTQWRGMNDPEKCKLKNGKINCKNIYKTFLSRVRARTHHRSFYFFAVTSVTRKLYFTGFQLIADTPRTNVNNKVIRVGLVRCKRYRKSRFSSCVSLNFSAVFCLSFSRRVTLVTAKKQHRCWKARARTRTCEKTTHDDLQGLHINFHTSTK